MFKNIFVLICLFVSALSFIYAETPSDNLASKARQMMDEYVATFNRHDANALGTYWTDDAIYTNLITDITIEGKAALINEFKTWFEEKKGEKLEVKLIDVKVIEPGRVEEKGAFRLTLKDNPTPIENIFKAVLVEQNGKLLFDEVYQIEIDEVPSHYTKLKELEWLVGEWVDADPDLTIDTIVTWDKDKNFIKQQFNMKIFDQQIVEGQHIIGWDPASQKIRSWIFDNNGGLGEGKWTKQNDNVWYVNTLYILPDGRKGSSINIYTKVDNDTYTWASEGRDIAGEILPNLPPVKVVRKSGKVAQ